MPGPGSSTVNIDSFDLHENIDSQAGFPSPRALRNPAASSASRSAARPPFPPNMPSLPTQITPVAHPGFGGDIATQNVASRGADLSLELLDWIVVLIRLLDRGVSRIEHAGAVAAALSDKQAAAYAAASNDDSSDRDPIWLKHLEPLLNAKFGALGQELRTTIQSTLDERLPPGVHSSFNYSLN